MPAFDVTAVPAQLTLKQGTRGTVVVTVTNRLSRAVTARAESVVEPASAAAWFTPPADPQRSFNSPQATEKFEWQVAVPDNAAATSVTFRVDVVDVEAKEDNYGKSNAVAITVPAVEVKPVVDTGGGIPKWIWPIVALVVIGAGIGIWLLLRDKGGAMPNVVGQKYADAESALKQANVVIMRSDSLSAVADTVTYPAGTVMAQRPLPDSALRNNEESPDTAWLAVQKDFTVVPGDLVNGTPVDAASKLGMAGLAARVGSQRTADPAGAGKVLATNPAAGSLVVRGDTVTINVGSYCTPPCARFDPRLSDAMIRDVRKANADRFRRAGVRPPGGGE